MAILKTIVDITDFDFIDAFISTGFMDTARVDHGYFWNNDESLFASWPEPAGNSVWIHYRFASNDADIGWDDDGIFNFYDSSGEFVLRMDIIDANFRWNLFGDTTPSKTFAANTNVGFFWDLNFVKNGTTDITVYIYQMGMLKATLTAANAGNKGIPVAFNTSNNDDISQGSCYMSEMIVADEDTRGWRIRQHSVAGHGIFQEWEGKASALQNRSAARTMHSNTLNQRNSFGLKRFEDLPEGALIDRVVVETKAIRGSTGLTRFNPFFRWESGTLIDDADVLVAEDMRAYSQEYTTSPDTGLAWTRDEMQGLQSGVRART